VTSWPETIAAFKKAVDFCPDKTLDIVMPNAGVAGPSLIYWLAQTPLDANGDPADPPMRTVNVNYLGVYNTIHAALYYFKAHPGPEQNIGKAKTLILVSSMGGYQPMPSVIDYNSAKWGVRGMFWSLRNVANILGEGKPKFRVNLIAPTWVKTNMTKGFQDRIAGADSTIKMAEVSDCVDVVLRMSSDEGVRGK
jgi:5'-hydroxyaverantin dehydrogenase